MFVFYLYHRSGVGKVNKRFHKTHTKKLTTSGVWDTVLILANQQYTSDTSPLSHKVLGAVSRWPVLILCAKFSTLFSSRLVYVHFDEMRNVHICPCSELIVLLLSNPIYTALLWINGLVPKHVKLTPLFKR